MDKRTRWRAIKEAEQGNLNAPVKIAQNGKEITSPVEIASTFMDFFNKKTADLRKTFSNGTQGAMSSWKKFVNKS